MLRLVCILVFLTGILQVAVPSPAVGIIGGQDAKNAEYPFMVSLQYCVRGTCQHACGGSIISPSWIVSAALCLTQVPSQGSYKAVAGITNLDDTSDQKQEKRISHAFIVPDYEGGAGPHDLAIFKTVTQFTFNSYIQPIRLVGIGIIYNGTANLVGWGSTGGAISPIMPNTLQTVSVNILSFDDCKEALDKILSSHPLDSTANTCTGPLTGGVSACTGDSGTPLVQDNTLLGINTWIITPCGTVGAPSVQTRISHYRNWITSTIDESLSY